MTRKSTRPFIAPPDAAGSAGGSPSSRSAQSKIAALEAQIRVLSDALRDLEHQLAEKDRRIEALNGAR